MEHKGWHLLVLVTLVVHQALLCDGTNHSWTFLLLAQFAWHMHVIPL